MNKRKRGNRRRLWIRNLLLACATLLAMGMCFLLSFGIPLLSASAGIMRSLHYPAPYHQPEIIETFMLPVNSDEPSLTQHEYSDWINITISGTIDLGDGSYHDIEWLCDEEGSCKKYSGLRIDGKYYTEWLEGFSHDGYEFRFHVDTDRPRRIAFQLITKNYPAATGALEVEVFYPWHSFGRGGR